MQILQQCPLFAGIAAEDLGPMQECLGAVQKHYPKNSFVFTAGEPVSFVGVVLSGSVHVVQEDFWGNRSILTHLEAGDLFAEAFSCALIDTVPVSVLAAENSDILLLDCRRIVTSCSSACQFHAQLIKNMLQILSKKNLGLTQKMEHLTKPTTREKLLSYLSAQAVNVNSSSFTIPFNRQELADYLNVDRSAMSNELSKMQKEGILTYNRNFFSLKQ